MATVVKDLGAVTAYAYAVAGGYSGTEAEFTELLGNIATDLSEIENLSVTVSTLPAGSSATASYSNGVLSLGIPKGDKGNTGATPNLSIGTVSTLPAGDDAIATITGTAEAPVLNLGIPEGQAGDANNLAADYSSSKTYSVGEYCIYNGSLYRCTTAITTAESWTAAHWTAAAVGNDLADFKRFSSDYNPTITPDKYVKYTSGDVLSISDNPMPSVVEFAVSEGMVINYLATIHTPDYRGLAFFNADGIYLSGVQMLSTVQSIDVPADATTVKATVLSEDDIILNTIGATNTNRDNLPAYVETITGCKELSFSKGYYYKTSPSSESDVVLTAASSFQTCKVSCQAGDLFTILRAYYNGNSNTRLWAFYNSAGEKIAESSAGGSQQSVAHAIIEAPAGAETVYFSMYKTTQSLGTPFVCKGLYVEEAIKAVYPNPNNPLSVVNKTAGMLSIFHTVGCIGDSLASGESAYKDGGTTKYVDLYDFSWGQCLARLTGNTYFNFSRGGLTTKTWMEQENGAGFGPNNIHAFDGNHDCDAYFIGLGQNDKNASMTVGTTADINLSDYTQNADTYCGNYGKIIQRIQELQPKAPIFCFTDPNPPYGDNSYNAVIPDIVALFSNVWIIDLNKYGKDLFTASGSVIKSQLRAGHYSAVGYQEVAFIISTYVDWIVRNNLSAFSQVEFIGTDYAWN